MGVPSSTANDLPSKAGIPSPRIARRRADVIVVGAGVFGSAMAVTLARQSRSVLLLEKSLPEPDRMVGEIMLPGGVQALEKLGLDDCLQGIDGVPIKGYQISLNGRPVDVPYPFYPSHVDVSASEKRHAGTARFEGMSLRNGRLLRNLRDAAAKEANITIVETEVNGLIKLQDTNQVIGVKSSTGGKREEFFAPLTIAADGSRSKFRKETTAQKPVSKSKFWALTMQGVTLPLPLHGNIVLGDDFSLVLLFQNTPDDTRAFINVPDGIDAAKASNGGVFNYMRNHVLPNLPPTVQSAFSDSLDRGKVRCMPNSTLPAAVNRVPGLLVAGDALNMRHPMTGGGMTVALKDVVLLRELLSPALLPDLTDHKQVMMQMTKFHSRRKKHSFVINVLAQAIYMLFDANNYYLRLLRQGLMEYFNRGGPNVNEMAGFLSGTLEQPMCLVYRFCAVGLFAVRFLWLSRPIWQFPLTLIDCICMLVVASWFLIPCIISEAMS
ncbi:hypothetical protein E4U21_003881 [Claviceps maximensis]|nr:hypothetical protein E4U21_003881 [Claviceps maximensis]